MANSVRVLVRCAGDLLVRNDLIWREKSDKDVEDVVSHLSHPESSLKSALKRDSRTRALAFWHTVRNDLVRITLEA